MKTSRMLNVPLFYQPKFSPFCGPACVKMVLAFHGHKTTLNSIASEMKVCASGIDMLSIGNFFLRRDFNVTIEMWYENFPNRFIGLTEGIQEEFLRWCRRGDTLTNQKDRIYRKKIQLFIESDGVLIPKPVSFKKLRAAIRKGCPPILNLDVSTLYKSRQRTQIGHYIIPVRITDNEITINDPAWKDYGGIKTYPTEIILHACYNWDAGAIFIEPK